MRIQKYLFVFAVAFALAGCDTDISGSFGEDPDPGSADFSSFVAIGDSLTAGYADGALYKHGQENSFPAIMAQQFAMVGGGEFDQPLMDDIMGQEATGSLDFGGIDLGRADRLLLVPTGDDPPAAPAPIMPGVSTDIQTRIAGAGMFNNMGVPGAKSFHALAPGYGELSVPAFLAPTANPYFARFASGDGVRIIDDVLAQVPTFFTLWLGNNDVLLYALDGADPTVSGESITPTGTFDGAFGGLITALTASPNTKGILINVPDVAAIPYFTTVPYNPVELDATTAGGLNLFFAAYNAAVAGSGIPGDEKIARTINFVAGDNPVLILDEDLTLIGGQQNIRFATAEDFILLPASAKIGVDAGGQYGITVPLVDEDVLTKIEKAAIDAARLSYNATIKAAAADPNLLFFDAEALLNQLNTTGILYGSGGISSTFAQGGGFSADGVHPSARGYAVIANEIFKVINEGFGAYIPPVDPNQYTTVFYQ